MSASTRRQTLLQRTHECSCSWAHRNRSLALVSSTRALIVPSHASLRHTHARIDGAPSAREAVAFRAVRRGDGSAVQRAPRAVPSARASSSQRCDAEPYVHNWPDSVSRRGFCGVTNRASRATAKGRQRLVEHAAASGPVVCRLRWAVHGVRSLLVRDVLAQNDDCSWHSSLQLEGLGRMRPLDRQGSRTPFPRAPAGGVDALQATHGL